jgi:pimeloyl-ACP methyl ester carboxylesterase
MRTLEAVWALSEKSTNVRSKAPGAQWTAVRALGWLAPEAAGRWASHLFLTPPAPPPLSASAKRLLERADDRFTVKLSTDFGGIAEESRLSVAVWGSGPAVYLLHGWGGRGGQYASFVEPLVSAGLMPVVFDAPLHGDSPGTRTSILHFAAALSAVAASVGPARSVVGHSAGAAACSFALRQGLSADRVVLLGSPAQPADLFRSFLLHLGVGERLHDNIRADVEHRYGFLWSDLAVRPPDAKPDLPALVVHDRTDREVPFTEADRVVRAWSGATLVATNGLGHRRILRDEEVVRRVVAFAAA